MMEKTIHEEVIYISEFEVPVHPLGFTCSMAVQFFEQQGWTYVGWRHTKQQAFAMFERELSPETVWFRFVPLGGEEPCYVAAKLGRV